MTQKERDLAESVLDIVPIVINAMGRSFPGIRKKLARIDARSVAYVAVCRATQTYDPSKSKPTTYFSTAVRNALLKELARSQRLRYDSPARVPCVLAEKVDARTGEEQRALRLALSVLPPGARQLVASRYFSRMSIREIAGMTSLNQKTVRRRLRLAVHALREILGTRDGLPSPPA
jgi:RNA polymerase sigma factor (sigma-70 family)